MIEVTSPLRLVMTFAPRASSFAFVLACSFAGIAVKVANTAWTAAVFALGLAVFGLVQHRRA